MAYGPTDSTVATAPASRPSRAIPEAFGPFRVLEQIGAGSLGPVYAALQPEFDCRVAVKQLRLGLPADHVQRILRQFDALLTARLDHLGIAASIGTGISDGSIYLIQEFAPGTSLAHLWDDGRTLGVPDAVRLAAQVAAALDFAASAGIDHGGLKPQDILVSDADVRVTGFGVVRALERCGVTPPARIPYAAPERVAGQAWDQRSDTFSLAAIALELVCGQPMAGAHAGVLAHIDPIEGTQVEALGKVFDQAFSTDIARRFDSATAFAQALQRACNVTLNEAGAFRRRKAFVPVPRPPAIAPPPRFEQTEALRPTVVHALAACPGLPDVGVEVDIPLPISGIAIAPIPKNATPTVDTIVAADLSAMVPEAVVHAAALPEIDEAEAVPVRSRRYSILWPLVLGPLAGVAIGLGLALMYVNHRAHAQPREEFIRHREEPVRRPPVQEPSRPVEVQPGDPADAPVDTAAVIVLRNRG